MEKAKVVEAMTTEKEHVNVVFIGHVGEWEVAKMSLLCVSLVVIYRERKIFGNELFGSKTL